MMSPFLNKKNDNELDRFKFLETAVDWKSHSKGKLGRVTIIAGSKRYTGAAYFAAMAAHISFAEIVNVITEQPEVLKPMMPECIVTGWDDDGECPFDNPYVDTFIVGSGLDKGEYSNKVMTSLCNWRPVTKHISVCDSFITKGFEKEGNSSCIILDGDGLKHDLTCQVIENSVKYKFDLILTCNEREFNHVNDLLKSIRYEDKRTFYEDIPANITLVRKSNIDKIYFSSKKLKVEHQYVPCRRPGGLGDLLAGIIAGYRASYLFCNEVEVCRV